MRMLQAQVEQVSSGVFVIDGLRGIGEPGGISGLLTKTIPDVN
jgi:hypothetical protein